MKTIPIKSVIGIFSVLMGAAGWAAPSIPIDPANYTSPVRVACVGDSITQGIGASSGKSYPSQLQAILGDKWQVQNFGVSARTMLRKGDTPYWTEQAFKDAHDFKPDVVIIMFGANDARDANWGHHDEFYGDYKDMVESFKNLPAKPRVFICRPTPAVPPGNYGITDATLQVEIQLIDKLAVEENVGLIDMHAALAGRPELFPDRIHPNDAGAGIMARTAAMALTGKN